MVGITNRRTQAYLGEGNVICSCYAVLISGQSSITLNLGIFTYFNLLKLVSLAQTDWPRARWSYKHVRTFFQNVMDRIKCYVTLRIAILKQLLLHIFFLCNFKGHFHLYLKLPICRKMCVTLRLTRITRAYVWASISKFGFDKLLPREFL